MNTTFVKGGYRKIPPKVHLLNIHVDEMFTASLSPLSHLHFITLFLPRQSSPRSNISLPGSMHALVVCWFDGWLLRPSQSSHVLHLQRPSGNLTGLELSMSHSARMSGGRSNRHGALMPTFARAPANRYWKPPSLRACSDTRSFGKA